MFGWLRAIVLVEPISCGGSAFAEGAAFSAHELMPGCRAYLLDRIPTEDYFAAKSCVEIVDGLAGQAPGLCPPPGSSQRAAVRAVVSYIEARPARMRESFQKLAREALRAAFPCRR